jgi:folate-binding protein YgfZ
VTAPAWAVPVARDVVSASGPDAVTYLQGQLSQDVAGLAVGDAAFSLLLAPQGHLVAYLRVTRVGDEELVLDTDAGAGEAVVARLRRFLLRTRCELAPLDWRCLAVRGEGSDATGGALPEGTWRVLAETPGTPGYDLLGPDPAVPDGVVPGDPAAYEALRIERGVPRMGLELTEKTIPAEAGIVDRSASFTKGCYTGQELVARIDSRGSNTPRRLRGLVLDGALVPPPGAIVTVDGAAAGAVTSAAWSATRDAPVALAYARRGTTVPGPCTVTWDDGEAAGRLAELPLG